MGRRARAHPVSTGAKLGRSRFSPRRCMARSRGDPARPTPRAEDRRTVIRAAGISMPLGTRDDGGKPRLLRGGGETLRFDEGLTRCITVLYL